MQTLDDLQKLTSSQSLLLYRLADLGYLTTVQVEELINRLVCDRFAKAIEYLAFAQHLDVSVSLNQPHIVSRGYYAMYHAARALVLHVRRSDVDDHDRLPTALAQILGTNYGDTLGRWRRMRNQMDYSPYGPPDLAGQAAIVVSDASSLLAACRDFLQNRGVSL